MLGDGQPIGPGGVGKRGALWQDPRRGVELHPRAAGLQPFQVFRAFQQPRLDVAKYRVSPGDVLLRHHLRGEQVRKGQRSSPARGQGLPKPIAHLCALLLQGFSLPLRHRHCNQNVFHIIHTSYIIKAPLSPSARPPRWRRWAYASPPLGTRPPCPPWVRPAGRSA